MIQAWVRLWDHHEHPRSMAAIRVGIALVVLFDFLLMARLGLVEEVLGPASAGGWGDPLAYDPVPWIYQVLPATTGTAWVLWGVIVTLCVLVAAGVFTPVSIALLVLCWAQMKGILPPAERGIDHLLRNVLCILFFSQSHAAASFDAWRRTGSFWGDGRDVPAWPRHVIVLQLVLMYFAAGVSKVGFDWMPWGGFSALWIILQDPTMSAVDLTPYPWLYPATQLMTAATMSWEWSAPVVLLLFWWRHTSDRPGRLRTFANRYKLLWAWLSIGVTFHVLLAVTLELGIFPYGMLACYPAFFHPDEWPAVGRYARRAAVAASALLLVGCQRGPRAVEGTTVRMDFGGDFWEAPFPDDARLRDDGTADLTGLPDPYGREFVASVKGMLDGKARGYATTAGIFLPMTGGIDTSALPDVFAGDDAPVFLVPLDDPADRHPIDVFFEPDGGPYGGDDMLVLLPAQGVPLRPETTYAAVVTRDLGDAGGEPLGVSEEAALRAEIFDLGVDPEDVAGVAVFTTGDPRAKMQAVLDDALSRPLPTPGAFAPAETFDGYCVFQATIGMPSYQKGEPPFLSEGGDIDGDAPAVQRIEEASFWVTVPKAPMPSTGWPTVVFVQTGGGGDRPLVDRGVRDADGNVLIAGSGLAEDFAAAGYAGVSIDLPHGGLRNPTGGDPQLLFFNFPNPVAMLDNFTEAAVEVALHAEILDGLAFEGAGDCAGEVRFDPDRLALFGHSMGATIAPSALDLQPRYGAAILSGAGGSWIENVLHKEKPLVVKPVAEATIGYDGVVYTLDAADPVLSLVQWAGDGTDTPPHAFGLVERGTHLLVFQGITDHYILPPIANALNLAIGADLGGPSLDEPLGYRTFEELLPLSGRAAIGLPASGNVDGVTAVVVQKPEDGVEDGHEVVFQRADSKEQLRGFLSSWDGSNAPTVPP
jgi:hypothetical protein